MQAGLKLSGRYALEALLGSGGMGEVWRGVDEHLDRSVAVKVLHEHLVDPELAGRFRREARIAARLQHPGITTVHDVGSDNGHLFIVMELLHGRDLATMLAEAPAGLPIDAAVSLTIQAAEALQAAHAGHVIHRDLKPANLFVLDGGQLKICDFGIAWAVDSTTRLTAAGQVIGTPAYMSPEQCQGQQVDERSDLYSLGCVLYVLLTGQPPFAEGQPLAIMLQHLNAAPAAPRTIRPDVPSELDNLILELLAKDPARRPTDADHVIAALRALCYTPTVKVEPFPGGNMQGLVRPESSAERVAREQAELIREQNRLLAELAGKRLATTPNAEDVPPAPNSQQAKGSAREILPEAPNHQTATGDSVGRTFRHLGIAITLLEASWSSGICLNGESSRHEIYEKVAAGDGAKFVTIAARVLNDAQRSIDLTCGYPIANHLIDERDRQFDPIGKLYKVPGNPECNYNLQPGFSADMQGYSDRPVEVQADDC